jgi:hypothetical protein
MVSKLESSPTDGRQLVTLSTCDLEAEPGLIKASLAEYNARCGWAVG